MSIIHTASFESDFDGWTTSGSLERTNTFANSGSWSIRYNGIMPDAASISRTFNMVSTGTVTVKFYASSNVIEGGSFQIRNGASILQNTNLFSLQKDTWHTFTQNLPSGSVNLIVRLTGEYDNSWPAYMYIDNIVVTDSGVSDNQNYTETGSGGMVLSGEGIHSQNMVETGSGGMVLSGLSIANHTSLTSENIIAESYLHPKITFEVSLFNKGILSKFDNETIKNLDNISKNCSISIPFVGIVKDGDIFQIEGQNAIYLKNLYVDSDDDFMRLLKIID